MNAPRPPSPAMIRKAAAIMVRNQRLDAIVRAHPALAPAAPRAPLIHEVGLSPEEIRFGITRGICREPRGDEAAHLIR